MAKEFWSETKVSQMRRGTKVHLGQTPREPWPSFPRSATSLVRPEPWFSAAK